MNEPIFALLLFASLSLLDSFFPSGLLLTKISLSTTLHVPFHSILALKFKGTGMILIHSSRNRHLKKITPNGNASYVFLKSLSDCHCQSTQIRISCNTFFFSRSIPLELQLELNRGVSKFLFNYHLYRFIAIFYSKRCAPESGAQKSRFFRAQPFQGSTVPPCQEPSGPSFPSFRGCFGRNWWSWWSWRARFCSC